MKDYITIGGVRKERQSCFVCFLEREKKAHIYSYINLPSTFGGIRSVKETSLEISVTGWNS